MSVDVAKAHPPETLRQAQRWQAVKDRYVAEGLCDRCAAQAAWAHQDHGDTWQTIHPPCRECQPIVARFPAPTPNTLWLRIPRPGAPGSVTLRNAVAENHGSMGRRFDAELVAAAVQGGVK